MKGITLEEEKILRRALFVPCETKDALHEWIKIYLGLDIPDTIVDPESNCSPMDMIWEVYDKARKNDDENFSRVMSYASRDSFKTLSAGVLEVLAVLHLDRDVAHMAAIKAQASKAQGYVKQMFRYPFLRDYLMSSNTEKTEILWFENPDTGDCIPKAKYDELPENEQVTYIEHARYIKIVLCTMQGANCVDPATLITMADESFRPAFEIRAGDRIKSFHVGRREFVHTTVKDVGLTRKARMRVVFDDGGCLVVSEDHAFLTAQGWRYARALKRGMRCFAASDLVTSKDASLEFDPDATHHPNPMQVLLGTLLGDASLTWPVNDRGERYGKGPRFQLFHCSAQSGYLKHKIEALRPLIGECRFYEDATGIKVWSKHILPDLAGLYEDLYGTGRKTITSKILDQLDLEGLAYWMMDDGAGCPKRVGATKDKYLSLATCCFDLDEHQAILKWLGGHGVSAEIGEVSNGINRFPVLQFSLGESRRLSALLDPYIYWEMKYKFPAPAALLVGRCIECGIRVSAPSNGRFSRCDAHPYPSNDRAARREIAEFATKFTKTIVSIEHMSSANLVDIHVDTDEEQLRNFVANKTILLHNSDHVPFFVVDEVDVVPKQNQPAYEQAKSIPGPYKGKEPITLLTSTRKFSFGNVQRELDNADKSGLVVRHWDIIDVTERCPPTRHLPEEPKIPIWYRREDFTAISQADWEKLDTEEQNKFELDQGYTGCLKKCKLFAMCRGNLATRQKEHPRNDKGQFSATPMPLLKSIRFTINKFRELTLDMAKAELMCWETSQEGLIYPYLSKQKHLLTPAQVIGKITGEETDPDTTFQEMLQFLKKRDGKWVAGIDFGFTHNFSISLMFVDGYRAFVVGYWQKDELDPAEKIDLLDRTIKEFDPVCYADTEQPDMIKFMKRHSYRCPDWSKAPGSVLGGIETVRYKLTPTLSGDPHLYFVDGGPDTHLLMDTLMDYHWELGHDGAPTKDPDEVVTTGENGEKVLDDGCDALRYAIMNTFKNTRGLRVPHEDNLRLPTPGQIQSSHEKRKEVENVWAKQIMEHVLGAARANEGGEQETAAPAGPQKKGGFYWDV